MAGPTPSTLSFSDGLALAMVASSDAPLLLLDGGLMVVAASRSFGRAFHVDINDAAGRSVFQLGGGEWNMPRLKSLLSATASGKASIAAYEVDLSPLGKPPRRLSINAQLLEYDLDAAPRLLVTVSDVTEARIAERLKDDLLREKSVLLQEVQHRVANSLQIIASVLLQSARTVRSEETREHLEDAHQRVLSIATVQKQLAAASATTVELRPYFVQLCQSLGASMIRDHDSQSIEVSVDKSIVAADVSISMGLIVTELVINALKHAFPDGRAGRITVGYFSIGPNWTLSVGDDGVGMATGADKAEAGLGTSIVEALARQLHARVDVADRKPGTTVSVIHTRIAAVGDAAEEVAQAEAV
ncbi:MAG: signal transduction histidine kinase [Caulobacter sp.]|nr:signal transduction histidine kinase [Caulobacter sp.]